MRHLRSRAHLSGDRPGRRNGAFTAHSSGDFHVRPRVLLAGDFPERPPLTIGGIQAVTWQLARGLAERGGFEVHTATCERFWQRPPPARSWSCEWGGCTAHYRRSPEWIPHVVSSWTGDAEYVRRKIAATGAWLVHAHGQVGYTIGALRSGAPHVVTPHGMLLREKRASVGSGALSGDRVREALWSATENWCLAHARHIVVISPYVRELIEPRTRAQLHDIPNPVDPAFFALERSESLAPALLSVGWLNERKRHELIVRALGLVRERVPGARLRIVGNVEAGDAQRLRCLRRLVDELDLGDAVDFLHGLSHEQLLEEHRRASVYVHAAEEESSPVAVAQAMAAELALCAVEIPGLHHLLVDGRTGVYAREATPQALALAILEVLENRDMARSLALNARHEARARFHPAAVAGATADLYREVLAQAKLYPEPPRGRWQRRRGQVEGNPARM
jgi:glycosyltransferase involved in cell wall biosynthesis